MEVLDALVSQFLECSSATADLYWQQVHSVWVQFSQEDQKVFQLQADVKLDIVVVIVEDFRLTH